MTYLIAQQVMDSGPTYAETLPGRFPVEPWSVGTNLVFLAIVVYWARRTRLDAKRHPLIVASLPFILLGFIGGSVYHATRSSDVWLVMDYGPISLVALMGCLYFWRRITENWLQAFLCVMVLPVSLRIYWSYQPAASNFSISFGYLLLAVNVVTPIVLHCYLNRGRHVWSLIGAAVSIAVAIVLRSVDLASAAILPMGTHFLWHLFGACSVFLALRYTCETAGFRSSIIGVLRVKLRGNPSVLEE